MGSSPQAMIFFGFNLYNEEYYEVDEDEKLRERIFEKIDNDDYRDLLNKYELGIGFHGYEYQDSHLYVKETIQTVEWGSDEVDPYIFHIEKQWDYVKRLRDFCKESGIPYKRPAWMLASAYG
jgi:hypothetical protein